jgi:cyclophilin family peptidyl-prolyl cis-trans isomerase
MRIAIALLFPGLLVAQQSPLTSADSALIGRILVAEDRRDSNDAVLKQAETHADPRVRAFVARARGRIRDARFAARDSFPPLPAPTAWPDAGWRTRYRALTRTSDCAALRAGLTDMMWPIRLRAADLVGAACASDDSIARTLTAWVDALPPNTPSRLRGEVSWHAAAHAIVGLARIRPELARPRAARMAAHPQWQVRMYVARADSVLLDTAALRTLARDPDGNVQEAAINALSKITGHTDDSIYLAALSGRDAAAVRAAAVALKGSTRTDVRVAAEVMFDRWSLRANASERDVRVALLEAAGKSPTSDRPPPTRVELPPRAVALALGADVRLRVTLSDASGGGSFVVKLRGDVAPMMAARVLALATAGYYNNGNWHRVEHDFVIQGGGPGSNEYVGYKDYLRDELGTVPHARGTVGMSTRSHDTGDAQWFVNLKDNLRLGRDYTVFAEVVEGIGVVDAILEGDVIARVEEVR